MHSESKKADFITYRSLNWSIQRISEKIGVCPRTLADWNGQYKDAIANLRYLHADVHFQNLVEARQKDLQTLSRRQQALDNELAQRDLSDIPTDKLMRLAILSREEFLEACNHARSLAEDQSYVPDPVPWYVRDRIGGTSKTEGAPQEKTEPVDSQKNAEPLPTPPSDAQPEALATITGTPTDDIVGEPPGKTAENEALETASESNADLKEPASNGEAPN